MKINKKTLTENKKLHEAEEPVVLNPNAASTEEIANEIKDNSDVSDATADKAAEQVKEIADNVDVDRAYIDIEYTNDNLNTQNRLVNELNKCLRASVRNYRLNELRKTVKAAPGSNIIIEGLPGSAKTAIVNDWTKNIKVFNQQLTMVYLDVKNADISAFLNGITVNTIENGKSKLKQEYTYETNLSALEKGPCVLFLDEFNRQLDDGIRGSLLTLINEKSVASDEQYPEEGASNRHYFKNLLFTVIACNPATRADRGAGHLNPAELGRAKKIDFNSTVDTAKDYFSKVYLSQIKLVAPETPHRKEILEDLLRLHDIANFIINDPLFTASNKTNKHGEQIGLFTDETKYADFDPGQANFSQRTLTNIINDGGGDLEETIDRIDGDDTIDPKIKQVLLQILGKYKVPTFAELCDKYGIDPEVSKDDKKDDQKEAPKKSEDDGVSEDDFADEVGQEDSTGIFTQQAGDDGKKVPSIDGAMRNINSFFDSFN